NTYDLTVLHATPTQYRYIVTAIFNPVTLKYLFIGAEKLTYNLVKRSFASVCPGCRVFNMYGPTEATIISAVLEIDRDRYDGFRSLSNIPIGHPTGNTGLVILDKHLKLCPVNIAGELYISGDGLASGYLNNPEQTAEKFIFTNFSHTSLSPPPPPSRSSFITNRLYYSGDLARWLTDGKVEYLGRSDHQVKVRGL
ncbi:MAG: AMP-binding protein, partial [bacterium]|nr:AMP-binding protein [bacterium]